MLIDNVSTTLSAKNTLERNEKKRNKALQSLASGHRINQASDDPAGQAISTKMAVQLHGLKQAKLNVKDGISLVQTAEQGLNQIQSPLSRIRQLVVEAGDGALSQSDRQKIQMEINQLNQGIDDVSNATNYNGIPLLSPEPISAINGSPTVQPSGIDLVFVIDNTGSMTNNAPGFPTGALIDVQNNLGSFLSTIGNVANTQVGFVNITKPSDYTPFNGNPSTLVSTLASYISGHTSTGPTNPYDAIVQAVPSGATGSHLGYRANSEKIMVLLTDAKNETSLYPQAAATNAATADHVHILVMGINDGNSFTSSEYSNLTSATGGNVLTVNNSSDLATDLATVLPQAIQNSYGGLGGASTTAIGPRPRSSLVLQVGANSDQHLQIPRFDASTLSLGINNVVVDPADILPQSLTQVDGAIRQVANWKSQYGSYKNQLDHLHDKLTSAIDNTATSRSTVTDVDIASEMTTFDSENLKTQLSQTMVTKTTEQSQLALKILGSVDFHV